jgi:hypothetical protein
MDEHDYCFVVLDDEGRSMVAQVARHDDRSRRYFRGVWHKMQQAFSTFHEIARVQPIPGWAGWKVHDWCDEARGCEDRQKFVAWCGDMMAGFLNLRPDFPSQGQPGQKVMYVEHMAAAPGNLHTPVWRRRVSHVGQMLLAYAVFQSKRQGFGGLLGLHAADGESLAYYRSLNTQRGGSVFLPERTGVGAPSNRATELTKVYLETTRPGADALLEDYHRV